MRTKILLIGFLLVLFRLSYGQAGSYLRFKMGNINTLSPNYKTITNTLSSGICYQYWFTKKNVAVDLGLNYTPINLANRNFECAIAPWFCNLPQKINEKYELVDVSLSMIKGYGIGSSKRLNFLVKGGYSVGRILKMTNITIFPETKNVNDNFKLEGLHKTVHFVNAGFELMYRPSNVWAVSLGTEYRITNIYDIRYSYISSFINQVSINRILGTKE